MIKLDTEQERIEKELNNKLNALMHSMGNQSVPSTKDKYQLAADALIGHAHCNIYSGPLMGGEMYCGWPLVALMDRVPHTERSAVSVAVKTKLDTYMSISRHSIIPPAQAAGRAIRPHTLEEMMAMRMRWGAIIPGAQAPWAVGFTHMAMHQAGDNVHIWIITQDGKSLILEDEAGLYPSDTLITKIRLLQRGETS